MLSANNGFPLELVPPGLLLTGWFTLWAVRGRISAWFFAWGTALVVLCFPAGVVLQSVIPRCENRDHATWTCGASEPIASMWEGGFLAFCCLGALVLVTLLVNAFAAERRPGG